MNGMDEMAALLLLSLSGREHVLLSVNVLCLIREVHTPRLLLKLSTSYREQE